ncbi:Ig-like domain-containing protein [Gemmatimonas sp.]|jgi:plastocyanin|uniref:Ig-like domain-containing protein n=1 Tax=Gemmatimonas sp. TaxID=1962908 RepID=UPI0037C17089
MSSRLKTYTRRIAFAGIALLAACDDKSMDVTPPPPAVVVARLELSAATTALTLQQTVQVSAAARTASGAVVGSAQPAWSSTAPGVATVNASGLVTGVAPGSATIRATVGSVSGTLDVTVTSAAGVLATVVVSAQDLTIQLGQLTQATVSGRDALGGPAALGTRVVTWSSSNPAIATINAAGVVTGVGVGTVNLQASVADGAAPRTGSIPLIVTGIPNAPTTADVFMPGLVFSPTETVVKLGGTVRFVFPPLAHDVIWDPRLAGSPADINVTSSVIVARSFPAVGVFPFKCTLHPGMDGTVIVSP